MVGVSRPNPTQVLLVGLASVCLAACGSSSGSSPAWSPTPGTLLAWQVSAGTPAAPLPVSHRPPPPGLAIVWHVDAADPNRLVASDWSGREAGWMQFANRVTGIGEQSPDGSRVTVLNDLYASDGTLLTNGIAGGTWADDSRHLCEVRGPNGSDGGPQSTMVSANESIGVASPAWLYVSVPGASRRTVAEVGEFGDHGNIDVAACSLTSDRAVVTTSFTSTITNVSVYALSTGQMLYTSTPSPHVFAVAATHDGRFLAELNASCQGSIIYDLSRGGQVRTRVQGRYVEAFSWDATTAVTTGPLGNPSYVPAPVSMIDLGSHRTIWSARYPRGGLDVDPSGTAFLLAVAPVSTGYQQLSETVFVVDARGDTTTVAHYADAATGTGIPLEVVGETGSTRAC